MDGAGIMVAYLAASLALGVAVRDKARSLEGFLVAGRSIGSWLLAFTFGATYFSSVVMVVGSSWAYAWGPKALLIPLANVSVGVLLAFTIVGRRVAVLSRRLNALTVPELVAKLAGDAGLQRLLGLLSALGLLLYLSVVAAGAAVVAAKAAGVPVAWAAAIVGGVLAAYVAAGGMYAVVLTDALQGLIMACIIGLVAFKALTATGLGALEAVKPIVDPGNILLLDIALVTSLAVWGLPQMVNRFYTAPSAAVVRRATGIAAVFAFIVTYGSFLSGLAVHKLAAGIKPVNALPEVTSRLLGPESLAVLAAAVLAASMSTADSVALTAASAIVYDVAGSRSLRSLRVTSAAVVLAAAVLAAAMLSLPQSAYKTLTTVFKTGWTLAAGATLVPLAASLYCRPAPKAAKAAALAAAATAALLAAAKLAATTLNMHLLPSPALEAQYTLTVAASVAAYLSVLLVEKLSGKRCTPSPG